MREEQLKEIEDRWDEADAGITKPNLDLVELVTLMTIASSRIPALIQAIRDRDEEIEALKLICQDNDETLEY